MITIYIHTFSPLHMPYFNVWNNNYLLELRGTFFFNLQSFHFSPWHSLADKQNNGITFPS